MVAKKNAHVNGTDRHPSNRIVSPSPNDVDEPKGGDGRFEAPASVPMSRLLVSRPARVVLQVTAVRQKLA